MSLFSNSEDEFNIEGIEEQLIPHELHDKITYWILKVIIEMGGHKRFIDSDNEFEHEDMAIFLGLEKYVDFDYDDFERSEPLKKLKKRLLRMHKRVPFSSSPLLIENIEKLSELIPLNSNEKQILEFVILLKQYDILENALSLLGDELNITRVKRILSTILNIPFEAINESFSPQSTFSRSAILTLDSSDNYSFGMTLDLINSEFADNMLNLNGDITEMIKESVKVAERGTLNIEDYSYIKSDLEILMPFLNKALEEQQKGVNILLYGLPGTGKTELSKTIANQTL